MQDPRPLYLVYVTGKVLPAGEAAAALVAAGIRLEDVTALHPDLPSGADLARGWTCANTYADPSLMDPGVTRPTVPMAFSTTTGADGLPLETSWGARITADALRRLGMGDLEQAMKAIALRAQLDEQDQWKTTMRDGRLRRTTPKLVLSAYHAVFISAADRLTGFLLPSASSIDTATAAPDVSHGWYVELSPAEPVFELAVSPLPGATLTAYKMVDGWRRLS